MMKKSVVFFLLIAMSLLLFSTAGCGSSDKNSSSVGSDASVNSGDSTVVSGSGVAVKNGDTVNIDFVGMLNGVAFDGGTANGYDLVIGSGTFIPGFEEQIIGMKVGEVKNINVTFPATYQEPSLAGKATVFKITLNSINGK